MRKAVKNKKDKIVKKKAAAKPKLRLVKTSQVAPEPASKANDRIRSYYSLYPWARKYYRNHVEFTAYVEASGKWETVLVVRPTSGASPEMMAEFIDHLINEHQKRQVAMHNAISAMQEFLNEGKTGSSERALEKACEEMEKVF
jgi:hypothetical protein